MFPAPGLNTSQTYSVWPSQLSQSNVPRPTKLDPTATDLAKISRLQALIRGWKTRNECFLPHQVMPFIQANFQHLPSIDHLYLSRIFCIEINKMSLHSEMYKSKSIKIRSYSIDYPFLKPQMIRCPYHLNIEIDEKSNNIQLMVISHNELGKGMEKHVYGALDFTIARKLENDQRKVTLDMQVAIVPHSDLSDTMKIHKEIVQNVKQGDFTDVPVTLKPSYTKIYAFNFKYKQKWFNTDAYQAATTGKIPLNVISNNSHIPFTFKDKLAVINQVNKTLQAMHAKCYVHADIKPQNLLITLIENNKVKCKVNDFDWSSKIDTYNVYENYPYWDILAKQGIMSPLADYFGLTIALGVILIPAFQYSERNLMIHPHLLLRQDVYESFTKRAVTEHFYGALSYSNDPVLDPLKKLFVMKLRLDPCYSLQELTGIIDEFKKNHASQLPSDHEELFRRVENEMFIIDKAITLIKYVVDKNNALCLQLFNHEVLAMKDAISQLDDPNDLLRYYRSEIVPRSFDPDYVSKEMDALASLSQQQI